jgi:hypothetical protein
VVVLEPVRRTGGVFAEPQALRRLNNIPDRRD